MAATIDLPNAAGELHIVLGQLLRRLRAENRLPISHSTVLSRLEREGPKTTSGLAAAERIRPQSMAQTVSELRNEGLIFRRPDEVDRRQILVEITPHGLATLAEDRRRRDGWLQTTMAENLTAREQRVMAEAVALLRRLADA